MATNPIKKAQNGTYYFRANLGYDKDGKKIQKYRSGFKTQREAKEAYSKVLLCAGTAAEDDEYAFDVSEMTFREFLEETYLPWYATQVRDSTFDNRSKCMKKHFQYFFRMKVTDIQPIHIQKWQVKMSKGYSANYVRLLQGQLSVIFDRALILGLVQRNPSRMVGNVRSGKVKIDFWTLEEFEKVIALLCKDDYYEHYLFISLLLLFMTGMRIGEASALQWADLDFETGLLTIDKSLHYRNVNEYRFTEPKTKASVRSIYIDSDTLAELEAWRVAQRKVLPDCGFVLSYDGTPTGKTTLPRAMEKLASLAGVHRIKVHALRHSHASLLINMGESPLLVKERLGHEKIQTTLGTYGHLYPNTNMEVARKLTGVLVLRTSERSIANYTHNQHTAKYHQRF